MLTLYHTTNIASFYKIKKSKYIGLDVSDYKKIIREICKIYNVDFNSVIKILDSLGETSEERGGVSFFSIL